MFCGHTRAHTYTTATADATTQPSPQAHVCLPLCGALLECLWDMLAPFPPFCRSATHQTTNNRHEQYCIGRKKNTRGTCTHTQDSGMRCAASKQAKHAINKPTGKETSSTLECIAGYCTQRRQTHTTWAQDAHRLVLYIGGRRKRQGDTWP